MRIAHQFMVVARGQISASFQAWRLRRAGLMLRPVLHAAIKAAIVIVVPHRVAQHRVYALCTILFNDAFDVVLKVRMLRMVGVGQVGAGERIPAILECAKFLPPLDEFLSIPAFLFRVVRFQLNHLTYHF